MHARTADTGWRIDERCTNCDVARQYAPGLIEEVDGRSAAVRQPRTAAEERALHAAAHACHTRSVRHGTHPLDPATDPFGCAWTSTSSCAATTRRTPQAPTPTC